MTPSSATAHPDRELLAVLQLFGKDQRICFRYEIKEGPKIFETEVRGKKFTMYNDTIIGYAKDGTKIIETTVEEPCTSGQTNMPTPSEEKRSVKREVSNEDWAAHSEKPRRSVFGNYIPADSRGGRPEDTQTPTNNADKRQQSLLTSRCRESLGIASEH